MAEDEAADNAGDEDEPKEKGKFGPAFRKLREAAKVSRADLDQLLKDAHKLSTGYTALLESGRIKPPDKAVCATLAKAIGLELTEVWQMAAEERLERLDKELADWARERCTQELEKQRGEFEQQLKAGNTATLEEARILAALRRLDLAPLPSKLAPVLEVLREPNPRFNADGILRFPPDIAAEPRHAFYSAIQTLSGLPPHVQHDLWEQLMNLAKFARGTLWDGRSPEGVAWVSPDARGPAAQEEPERPKTSDGKPKKTGGKR
jgi:transcriptional regulator with XRE-family HTH domain